MKTVAAFKFMTLDFINYSFYSELYGTMLVSLSQNFHSIFRVRLIPVSGIGYWPIVASIGGYRYRPILILVSAPIPVVRLPVSTVNIVACTPIVCLIHFET